MKQNKSFIGKLLGKNLIVPQAGDIFYFKNDKTYWLYLGDGSDIQDPIDYGGKPEDISKDGHIHLLFGLSAMDYFKKLAYDPEQMFKVNDDIIFHFKFTHNRSIEEINRLYKSQDIMYIMTMKDEERSALNAAYTLYQIREKRS